MKYFFSTRVGHQWLRSAEKAALGAPHNKRNKEQRIRISTYQKLYSTIYDF